MGLRRHQVENLIRRGPNFYWRARIPVGFQAAGKNTRLSLSLRLSDRKKASVVARRLNALLLEIELLPRARMATKEQLAKIFALEIESMRDEIEKLDLAAKRSGSLRDSVHREADRQVGYAYRLLEAYGPAEDLSFETGSEVHEALLEVGATEGDMPFIAETFRSEREGALTDRDGRTKSPFLRDVLHRMTQVGLDDTALNRDAAAEEIFRARADVLLASADDPRKPKLSGGSRRPERQAADTLPADLPQRPQRHLRALISSEWGAEYAASKVTVGFQEVQGLDVCIVDVDHGTKPLFVNATNKSGVKVEKFYIRSGNLSAPIERPKEIADYVKTRFG
jgi:hypothetical protein